MDEHDPDQTGTLPTSAAFKLLVEQANAGVPGALDQLNQLLDGHPEVWQRLGDLAAHTQLLLIGLIAGDDQLLTESLKRKLQELKAQLGGDDPSPLERMTVERLTACWLQLQHIDVLVGKAQPGSKPAKFLLQRQSQADRAYNAALKSLTTVRLLLPSASKVDATSGGLCPANSGGETLVPPTIPLSAPVMRKLA